MNSILFKARSYSMKPYLIGDIRYSSIIKRPTLTEKEEKRKKYGKSPKKVPLNQEFILRTAKKAHTYQCHSPEKIRILKKPMWMFWAKKMIRKSVSLTYQNRYTLNRIL